MMLKIVLDYNIKSLSPFKVRSNCFGYSSHSFLKRPVRQLSKVGAVGAVVRQFDSIRFSNRIKLDFSAHDSREPRPLTLIFAWMLAKDKHLEKYRQLWFERGFDVLTIKTSPLDLLLPPIGGRVVAKNLVKCLSELNTQYNEVVVHAFSVGGYQFGETLLQLRDNQCNEILSSIKGVIFDSLVLTENAAPGLSRAITLNPIVQPMIEHSIHAFLKLFHNISVKNYLKSEEMLFKPIVKYSGLFYYSMDDLVVSVNTIKRLEDNWRQSGNRVEAKCWQNSTHVLHYRDHQKEYEQCLDRFIKSLELNEQHN